MSGRVTAQPTDGAPPKIFRKPGELSYVPSDKEKRRARLLSNALIREAAKESRKRGQTTTEKTFRDRIRQAIKQSKIARARGLKLSDNFKKERSKC